MTATHASSLRAGAHRLGRRRIRTSALLAGLWSLLAVLVVAGALAFHLAGGRWFIIETPSMGQAAPVGSVVVDIPVTVRELAVGDIVSFNPPTAPQEVYTHRVVEITGGLLSTKGDINGVSDPWTLSDADIIGQTSTVLPGVGWLIRSLPYLLVGSVIVWAVTRLARTAATRTSYLIVGLSLVASVTAFIVKPFVGVTVLATNATSAGATAQIVSTGMLPIRVQALGGSSVDLVSGQVGYLRVPTLAADEAYRMSSSLNLSFWGWVLMGLVCAIPLLWCLIVGLPPERDDETSRSRAARPLVLEPAQ